MSGYVHGATLRRGATSAERDTIRRLEAEVNRLKAINATLREQAERDRAAAAKARKTTPKPAPKRPAPEPAIPPFKVTTTKAEQRKIVRGAGYARLLAATREANQWPEIRKRNTNKPAT